jgi:hypothetical protein
MIKKQDKLRDLRQKIGRPFLAPDPASSKQKKRRSKAAAFPDAA